MDLFSANAWFAYLFSVLGRLEGLLSRLDWLISLDFRAAVSGAGLACALSLPGLRLMRSFQHSLLQQTLGLEPNNLKKNILKVGAERIIKYYKNVLRKYSKMLRLNPE